jgi:hypothetical protein
MPILEGDRIELVRMVDDPDPIPEGTQGTVISVSEFREAGRDLTVLAVDWDIDRSLMVILPVDTVRKVA